GNAKVTSGSRIGNRKIPFLAADVLGHDAIEEHGKGHAVHGRRAVLKRIRKGERALLQAPAKEPEPAPLPQQHLGPVAALVHEHEQMARGGVLRSEERRVGKEWRSRGWEWQGGE